ncbi:ABC transporter substrate-binding protein [Sediminimonas qiaohouensis]|nr:ABC transporter substrate-binding protein [Sediminimonas qiaohouensis]
MHGYLNLAAAVALSFGAGASAAAADTVDVGVCVSWPGYAMLEVARQNDLTEHDLNITIFEDPLGGHSALAAGQIDVYGCTADYTPLIVDRGTDVVNVAFLNPSYGVDHIIVAPEVEPEDLAGKKVSAPQAYIGHLLMGIWLDSVGITPDEVEWVNLNADEAVGPMLSGDISAAYMYEPWISKVLAANPGSRSVVNTADPEVLKTGIFMDALYMNKNFIEEKRDVALDVLKARWDGLGYWNQNTAETNKLMANFLQWPEEDIGYVIGTNGKSFEGGIYMLDFDESARLCGVLAGEGPFGMANGSMVDSIAQTNEWWVKLGLMDKTIDAAKGMDCSLMGDLAEAGYRQSLTAN